MLYQALAPALGPLLALVPPLLEHASRGSKEAASAARGMLRLEVAVVECLGQEVGPLFVFFCCVVCFVCVGFVYFGEFCFVLFCFVRFSLILSAW